MGLIGPKAKPQYKRGAGRWMNEIMGTDEQKIKMNENRIKVRLMKNRMKAGWTNERFHGWMMYGMKWTSGLMDGCRSGGNPETGVGWGSAVGGRQRVWRRRKRRLTLRASSSCVALLCIPGLMVRITRFCTSSRLSSSLLLVCVFFPFFEPFLVRCTRKEAAQRGSVIELYSRWLCDQDTNLRELWLCFQVYPWAYQTYNWIWIL